MYIYHADVSVVWLKVVSFVSFWLVYTFNSMYIVYACRRTDVYLCMNHLFQAVFGLKVRVVPCTDCPHGGWFIASIGLSRILKV